MIHFYIERMAGEQLDSPTDRAEGLKERFQRLMQRLLPPQWRLELRWQSPSDRYLQGYYVTRLASPPTDTQTPAPWSRELARTLRDIIGDSRPLILVLTAGSPQVNVGAWIPSFLPEPLAPTLGTGMPHHAFGMLDVQDFERLRPQFAASAMVHELIENRARQWRGISPYGAAHQQAAAAEFTLMGRHRLTDHEYVTSGVNTARPPAGPWQWWIPYQGMRDRQIIAAVLQMVGGHLQSNRLAGFPTLATFEAAAQRAGLGLLVPDAV